MDREAIKNCDRCENRRLYHKIKKNLDDTFD